MYNRGQDISKLESKQEYKSGLENINIGFIGIGNKPGAVGIETVPLLCDMPQIEQIFVKNSDKSKKDIEMFIKRIIKKIIKKNHVKAEGGRVEYASVEDMRKDCDIIVLSYETSVGASKKNIPFDYYFRQRCFNSNVKILKEDIAPRLAGYEGLIIDVTNPLEAMCYYLPEMIPGLEREQVIGFQYVDTLRLREECKTQYESHKEFLDTTDLDELLIESLKESIPRGGFALGEHSPNMTGVFSPTILDDFEWNYFDALKSLNDKITKSVIKEGIDIARVFGSTGKPVAPDLQKLIEGAVNQTGPFTATYFIKFEKDLSNKIYKKYKCPIEGICTGVPIEFYLKSITTKYPQNPDEKKKLVIRARLAKDYRLGRCEFDFENNILSPEEIKQFRKSIEITAIGNAENPAAPVSGGLVETYHLKQRDRTGIPRYLVQNNVAVMRSDDLDKILLIDLAYNKNKKSEQTNPALMFPEETHLLEFSESIRKGETFPLVTAFATHKNNLVVSTCGDFRLLHAFEFPYMHLMDLVHEKEAKLRKKPIVDIDSEMQNSDKHAIKFMTLDDSRLYLAEDKAIEKRLLHSLEHLIARYPVKGRLTDDSISCLQSNAGEVYCGLSNGQVLQFDTDLRINQTYYTDAPYAIKKIKTIVYHGIKQVYAMNEKGQMFVFLDNKKQRHRLGTSLNCCFDVQVEKFEDEDIAVIYSVDENNDISIEAKTKNPILRGLLNQNNFEKTIECGGPDITDLFAKGDELFVISEENARRILDKGHGKFLHTNRFPKINQFGLVQYKK